MQKFGNWEPLGPLGEGGQSEVRLVRRSERTIQRAKSLEKLRILHGQGFNDSTAQEFADAIADVARKDVADELAAQKLFNKTRPKGAAASDRLHCEIAVLSKNKGGLPKLLSSSEDDKWIVTEFFELGTVEKSIARYRGDAVGALKAFRSLLVTMAFSLHSEMIVHRDIKPANVFLGNNGTLIPGDFGIVFLPDHPRLTFTGESVGPSDYMPPWADTGMRVEDIRPSFDVYMLGKLLWCMVAGRLRLFREDQRDPQFDVEGMFPNTPYIHLINPILDKCVVRYEKDCAPSAKELLAVVDDAIKLIDQNTVMFMRGGRLVFPCRVCGKGYYSSDPGHVMHARYNDVGQQQNTIRLRLFTCTVCAHQEFFAPNFPEEAFSKNFKPWAPDAEKWK